MHTYNYVLVHRICIYSLTIQENTWRKSILAFGNYRTRRRQCEISK